VKQLKRLRQKYQKIGQLGWIGCFGAASCLIVSCAVSLSQTSSPPSPFLPVATPVSPAAVRYKIYALPRADAHVLTIPADGRFTIVPAVAAKTTQLETFAQQQTIAVLNGGFFDPQNQQSTSYMTIQGRQVADPTQNQRLMSNPDLAAYLDKILNRSEFRHYQCGRQQRYAIALHRQPVPRDCQLLDALGAGPQLLPSLQLETEGFTAIDASGAVVRDALGSSQPNARTAVGITATGDVVWVMVAQKTGVTPSGITLPELTHFLQTLGAVSAINLDGGSSSALFYQGKTIHGKLDAEGKLVIRPVKSVLLLQTSSQ
jgi:hypothetical protein